MSIESSVRNEIESFIVEVLPYGNMVEKDVHIAVDSGILLRLSVKPNTHKNRTEFETVISYNNPNHSESDKEALEECILDIFHEMDVLKADYLNQGEWSHTFSRDDFSREHSEVGLYLQIFVDCLTESLGYLTVRPTLTAISDEYPMPPHFDSRDEWIASLDPDIVREIKKRASITFSSE